MQSAREERRSGSEQRQRYYGDAVRAAVGVAARGEDHTVGDRFGAELRVKPVEVPNITIADCLAEFHLDRYDSAIVAFNDQIDLVVGLLGAQMADSGERGLGVGSHALRGEGLEECTKPCPRGCRYSFAGATQKRVLADAHQSGRQR